VSLFSPRLSTKTLTDLCRRLSIALSAGIDVRTVWSREAERAHGHLCRHLTDVSLAINKGESLAEAFSTTGDFFPPLFLEMIEVGEKTGHLDEVLAQLADHYQNQLDMRRAFLAAIAWPMVQLCLAVAIVGFLIWVMGLLREITRSRDLDLLGFGLIGNQGLAIYAIFVGVVAAAIWLMIRAANRGLVWTQPIQRFVLRVPGLGKPLQTMALARLAWSMNLTMNAGMDLRQALRLSLRSTQNAFYIDQISIILAGVSAGKSIHECFTLAGGYPDEFLDVLAVGEQSGRVVESMGTLARQYQERARAALSILTSIAGWFVWAVVAAIIIALVFRLFSFYLGMIDNAGKL